MNPARAPILHRTGRRVAAIGEGMLELVDAGASLLRQSYGGDTLNTAVYLARCLQGPGIAVDYVTALGADTFSDDLVAAWRTQGLGTDHIRRVEGRGPGLYWVSTDDAGERSFHYWRRDSAARQFMGEQCAEEWAAPLLDHRLVYFSGITLAILEPEPRARFLRALQVLRAHGVTLAFDSNYRPVLWDGIEAARSSLEAGLCHCDIALVSFDDERRLWQDASPSDTAQRLAALGATEIVVKNGSDPCLLRTAALHETMVSPPVGATPRDTTAAGDSFNAAYLAARLLGVEPIESARRGHALAAVVIQHPGAIVPRAATDAVVASFAADQ